MDKRLVTYIVKRPWTWLNCAKVLASDFLKRKQVVLSTGGFKIKTGIGNGQGLFCAIAGRGYEPEMGWFIDQMKPGKTFLDVGANIGVYSLHAAKKLGPAGKVHAFEPTSETFGILEDNIALNRLPNIAPHRKAVGNHSGVLYLVEGGRPASNSTSEDANSGVPVDAVTLDQFYEASAIPRIDYVKVDIEGGEKAFFEGGLKTLSKDKPLILFESDHTAPLFPERDVLRNLGYKIFRLAGSELVLVEPGSSERGNMIALHGR
jgi:FkbM family methyltransferase